MEEHTQLETTGTVDTQTETVQPNSDTEVCVFFQMDPTTSKATVVHWDAAADLDVYRALIERYDPPYPKQSPYGFGYKWFDRATSQEQALSVLREKYPEYVWAAQESTP